MPEAHSQNFAKEELRCRCPKCLCQVPNECTQEAVNKLQEVRTRFGKPIVLTSGFRCLEHPIEARKARGGQHTRGTAFDIQVPWGRDRAILLRLVIDVGFVGIGFHDSFLHADDRDGLPTTWSY